MEVFLFYALLIGGIGLAIATYVGFIFASVALVGRRFGTLAGLAFAATMAAVMWSLYEPPFGGMSLSFVPPGMAPMVFISGTFSEPPVAMLVASVLLAAMGLLAALAGWLLRPRDVGA